MTKELSPLRKQDRRRGAMEERDAIVRWLMALNEGNADYGTLLTLANWIRAGMHEGN